LTSNFLNVFFITQHSELGKTYTSFAWRILISTVIDHAITVTDYSNGLLTRSHKLYIELDKIYYKTAAAWHIVSTIKASHLLHSISKFFYEEYVSYVRGSTNNR